MLEERHYQELHHLQLHATDDGYALLALGWAETQVFNFAPDGTLVNEDTLATDRVFYSFLEQGALRLVTVEHEWIGDPERIVATIVSLDAQGQFVDSLLLFDAVMDTGETVAGVRFDFSHGVLSFALRTYFSTAQGTEQRFWLGTYDGSNVVQGQPFGPISLRTECYLLAWNICRTAEGKVLLAYNRYCPSESQLRITEVPLDGTVDNPQFVLPLADAQRVNWLELIEVEGSLVSVMTMATEINEYAGAYVTAIPLSEILDAPDPRAALPDALDLSAYPNPFNATATVSFALPVSGRVTLKAYDATGREVETLAADAFAAGRHSVQWEPVGLASGKYFCRLETGTDSRVIPLVMIK